MADKKDPKDKIGTDHEMRGEGQFSRTAPGRPAVLRREPPPPPPEPRSEPKKGEE